MTQKILIGLAVLCAVALGVLYGNDLLHVHQGLGPPASLAALAPQNPAKSAPAVAFYDLTGGRHTLADFKGRYVLLNLWATWCAPCVSELPALARLKERVPGLAVLAVDVWKSDKPAQVQSFLKTHDAAALGTLTDKDVTLERSFGAYGLPMTVLIDPKGNVVAKAEGAAKWDAPDAVAYLQRLAGG
jgi:thiol-disulfide isomerase/thioredoxin